MNNIMNQAFSKIWILIILIVFTVGGFFTWHYFKPEVKVPEEVVPEEVVKEKVADWEDYLNERYRFKLKYPDTYQYKEYPLEGVGGWGIEFYEPGKNPLRVRIYNVQPVLEYYLGAYYFLNTLPPFRGWVNPEFPTSGHRIVRDVEPIIFGFGNYRGIKGVSAIGMADPYVSLIIFFQPPYEPLVYVFEFPGYYTTELPPEEEKWKEKLKKKTNMEILNQMLSTFRFLE